MMSTTQQDDIPLPAKQMVKQHPDVIPCMKISRELVISMGKQEMCFLMQLLYAKLMCHHQAIFLLAVLMKAAILLTVLIIIKFTKLKS